MITIMIITIKQKRNRTIKNKEKRYMKMTREKGGLVKLYGRTYKIVWTDI